jgi:hypothetical protein
MGPGGCPFLTGGSPSRRKGMSAGEELRPYQEAEARREVDHWGRRCRWGDVHCLHQYAPRALQPQQFQRQSQQRWQFGGAKLSVYTPISSQLCTIAVRTIGQVQRRDHILGDTFFYNFRGYRAVRAYRRPPCPSDHRRKTKAILCEPQHFWRGTGG